MRTDQSKRNPEAPPLFRHWWSWYLLVLANLAFLIALFYWLTKSFR